LLRRALFELRSVWLDAERDERIEKEQWTGSRPCWRLRVRQRGEE
jgi:hypothetical protein